MTIKLNGSFLDWTKRAKGEYLSSDGKWRVQGKGRRAWYVYLDNELWGEWQDSFPFGKEYSPFISCFDAVATIDEMIFRGFD